MPGFLRLRGIRWDARPRRSVRGEQLRGRSPRRALLAGGRRTAAPARHTAEASPGLFVWTDHESTGTGVQLTRAYLR